MKISVICFTEQGFKIAQKVAKNLENCHYVRAFGHEKVSFMDWTKDRFLDSQAIIFISAMGICIRAIAPNIKNKLTDPAVLVVDDCANFCISVLSGHVGGANELAYKIAEILNSTPVITTATDVNKVFAIDVFAKKNDFLMENTGNIKKISAKLLNNQQVYVKSDFKLMNLPENMIMSSNECDLYLTYKSNIEENALVLRKKCLNIGIGCRKDSENVGKSVEKIFNEQNFSLKSIKNIASIDIKSEETGIHEFASKLNIKPVFYSANQLNSLKGQFTQSEFVKKVAKTDNVCERSAKMLGDEIILRKTVLDGVTISVAIENLEIDFKNGV